MARLTAMDLLGHKRRSTFDRYHVIGDADCVEAVQKLAALHGAAVPEPRKVVAVGDALTERIRTVPAQSPRAGAGSGVQRVAHGGEVLASPSIVNSNRVLGWLREMDRLRLALAGKAA